MVEQSIEAALVVSSSLILGIKYNRCAGIGRQVPLRTEWFHNCTSSSLVICNLLNRALETFGAGRLNLRAYPS